jgi:hypothetical protein
VTIFAAEGTARTFDYQAGDVGIVPRNMGHFIENLSDDEEIEVLEIFRSDKFQDFSLFQWMGETPQRLVKEHLFATDPKSGKKFEEAIKNAEKDPIRDTVGHGYKAGGGGWSKHSKSSWRGSSLKDVEPRDRSMLDQLTKQ